MGTRWPIFFDGQRYMGALEAYTGADPAAVRTVVVPSRRQAVPERHVDRQERKQENGARRIRPQRLGGDQHQADGDDDPEGYE